MLNCPLATHGLLDALEYLMPGLEHRLCSRHLHANFKSNEYKGNALRAATRATNENQFKYYLSVIKCMDTEAYNYIEKVDSKMW